MKLVAVRFGDPMNEILPSGQAYTYIFDLPEKVKIGDWVYVNGMDGMTTAVVVGVPKTPPHGFGLSELSRVVRLVSAFEMAAMGKKSEKHAKQREKDFQAWWWHAAYCSGFTPNPPPHPLPEGFPVLYGDKAVVSKSEADEVGRAWWKIYKMSVEELKPQVEIDHYQAVANYWFRRRDSL